MKVLTKKSSEEFVVGLRHFSIITDKPEEFIDELEQLCRKYCDGKEFFFNYKVEG